MSEMHLIHDTWVTPPGWRGEEIDGRRRGARKAGSQRLPNQCGAVVAANQNGLPADLRNPIQACRVPGTSIAPTVKPSRAAGSLRSAITDQVDQAGENYGRKN